ncbi:hypothetical protein AAVH_06526 [Aphelenchoides avenae]|nr:hypothetical protein AAVH_06526 [Aphelenchus avenae]
MPTSTSSSRDARRTKKEKLVRRVFRRKTCYGGLVINLILFGVFVTGIYAFARQYARRKHELSQLDREDRIIDAARATITFTHCEYERRDFDTTLCGTTCGTTAVAWRRWQVLANSSSGDDLNKCVALADYVNCHNTTPCAEQKRRVHACPGFDGSILPHGYTEYFSFGSYERRVAIIDNLAAHIGRDVHASELVARCPLCLPEGVAFKFSDTPAECYRKLLTIRKGWPRRFEYCDRYETHPDVTLCSALEKITKPVPQFP